MKKIDEILNELEDCLINKRYESIETESIELKDLSGGDEWKQLYVSICAFLNTDGGIVICGVNENNEHNQYKLNGFDRRNEPKLDEKLRTSFTNENGIKLNLSNNFKYEFKSLLDKEVCVVYVEKLPEDEKFAFYEKTAYKRVLTGKPKISKDEIDAHNELKKELLDARELNLVSNASISDLNVDKLNDYLVVLNIRLWTKSILARSDF